MNTLVTGNDLYSLDHMPLTYTPKFWDPKKAYEFYVPDPVAAFLEGAEYARKHNIPSAAQLIKAGVRKGLDLTDLQNAFMDYLNLNNRELPVSGACRAVLRLCARLIEGAVGLKGATEGYAYLWLSEDGHPGQHISWCIDWLHNDRRDMANFQNPVFLEDEQFKDSAGNKRKAACLTLEDEKTATFKLYGFEPDGSTTTLSHVTMNPHVMAQKKAVEYWKILQDTGQGDIFIFTPHAGIGRWGHGFHPLLVETMAFFEAVRQTLGIIIGKGHDVETDAFGKFAPCNPYTDHPQGGYQTQVLETVRDSADAIESSGVATDFCQRYSQGQFIDKFKGTKHINKLRFIDDGVEAYVVPNHPLVEEQKKAATAIGVKYISHDSPNFN